MEPTGNELSPRLQALPYDEKRKIPVPKFNVMPDGSVNYMLINPEVVYNSGKSGLCGICSEPLDYWIAFIGGPISLANRSYLDPPMHKECALAAVKYCPHINRKVHRRAPDEKFDMENTWISNQSNENKPDEWIIVLTRSYKMVPHQGFFMFKAAKIADTIRFSYDDTGRIQQEP